MAKIEIRNLVLGMISTNVWFIRNTETGAMLVIDPADSVNRIEEMIRKMNGHVEAILLTHAHFDHIGAANELRESTKAPIYAGTADARMLADPHLNFSNGLGREVSIQADTLLNGGEVLELAGLKIRVIHTPGHTKGGLCFYLEEQKTLISGDTLFYGSYGRTDFPGGSSREIAESVHGLLTDLPEDVKVYPGHGETTSVRMERQINPLA